MVYSATVKESVQPWCAQRQQRGRYGYGELMGEVPVVGEGGYGLVGRGQARWIRLWLGQRQFLIPPGYGVLGDSEGVGTALACPAIAKESVRLWCARPWRCDSAPCEGLKILE